MIPRLLPALLVLLALVAAVHIVVVDLKRPLRLLRSPVGITLAVFVAYLLVNASWAMDRPEAFAKAAVVLLMTTAAFLVAASYSLRTGAETEVLAKSALIGSLLGLAALITELTFDAPLMRFVNNSLVPLIDLNPKSVWVADGKVTGVAENILNRNVASVVMLFIPSLLFAAALIGARTRAVAIGSVIAATAACVFMSQSGTSAVAFVVAGVVLIFGVLSLRATRLLLAGGWAIVTILAVPLGALPYALNWQQSTWLSFNSNPSIVERIYIWRFVADKVYERPIIGIGIRSSRVLHLEFPVPRVEIPMTGEQRGQFATRRRIDVLHPGRHPHNIFLQTWLELGAIGVGLLLTLGLAALWQIRQLPPQLERAGYALFAACCAIGISGFDLWQTWLIASLALSWTAMLLAVHLLQWKDFAR